MNGSSTCRRCGTELTTSAPEGLCPQCILQEALVPEATRRMMAEDSHQEHEGSVIGRYKLMEKLGEGGFGEVWVAEQREPDLEPPVSNM